METKLTSLPRFLATIYPEQSPKERSRSFASRIQAQIQNLLEHIHQEQNPPQDSRNLKQVNFGVETGPSTIEGADLGLFIKGKVSKGDVVAFYEGTVYSPQEASLFCTFVFNDNKCPLFLSIRLTLFLVI